MRFPFTDTMLLYLFSCMHITLIGYVCVRIFINFMFLQFSVLSIVENRSLDWQSGADTVNSLMSAASEIKQILVRFFIPCFLNG